MIPTLPPESTGDEIIREVRAIREQIAEEAGYDMGEILARAARHVTLSGQPTFEARPRRCTPELAEHEDG
jgi:hypothetical protein